MRRPGAEASVKAARRRVANIACAVALFVSHVDAQTPVSETAPPEVLEWAGACPTDCCGYGSMWTATTETTARATSFAPGVAPHTEPPAFTIPAGGVVRAVTGTLFTLEKGTVRVDEDFSTDATFPDFSTRHKQPVTFRAGDTITLLAPRGNGVYRLEHKGRPIDANLFQVGTAQSCGAASARCAGVITKQPVVAWWVMVLNEEKQSGWVDAAAGFKRGGCR